MTNVQIEAGTLAANLEDRTVSGLLLKFGEVGRTNLGRFKVQKGAFKLPKDIGAFLGLDLGHDRTKQIGTALMATETDDGIWASWKIADNPEGNALLAAYNSGDPDAPRKLSIEVDDVRLRNGVAIGGNIHGAGVVKAGAFPSSTLMAADTVDVNGEPIPAESTSESSYATTNSDGSQYSDSSKTTEEVEDLGDGKKRITRTTVTVTEVKEPDQPAQNQEETVGANSIVPATLAASAGSLVAPEGQVDEKSAREVFTLMASAMKGDQEAATLLAALTDIKTTPNGAGTFGSVIQPSWLGEVWQQKTYNRRYMPLLGTIGTITSQDEKGFTVSAAAEPVQPWAGNKSDLPSSSGTTDLVSSTFQRWGWAADIAREFFDIPGNTAVIEAFLRLVNNSYARQTDKWTLAQMVASSSLVAPDTYPVLDATRDYPVAIKQLIQGVDLVSADPIDDTPAFAIANAAAWREIIYAPKDALPEWLSLSFGITDQSGTADGKVRVVRGDIGIDDTPAVMVGAQDAAHVNELGGESPLNLSALDIARGGIDKAVVGYTQFMADYADALVIVGAADA